MIAVVCISDGGGMLFNKRRQTKDRVLIEDLLKFANGRAIYISEFSKPLFPEGAVISVPNPLEAAGECDIAFVEDKSVYEFKEKIGTLILYKWNRKYPSDFNLDFDAEKEGMKLFGISEFQGSSHEKITREAWQR